MSPALDDPAETPPMLRVVRGHPSDAELAAVLAVLLSRGSGPADPGGSTSTAENGVGSGWSAYWRSVRAPVQPGPGAWRLSGRV